MSQDEPTRGDPAAPRPLIPGFGPDPTEPLPPAPAAPAQPWPGHIAAVGAGEPQPGEGSSRPDGRPAGAGARDPQVHEDQGQEADIDDGTLVDHASTPLVGSPGAGAGTGAADADRSAALAAAAPAAPAPPPAATNPPPPAPPPPAGTSRDPIGTIPNVSRSRAWARRQLANWRVGILRFLCAGLAVVVAVALTPGLSFTGWRRWEFVQIAVIFGLLNLVLKPLLQFLVLRFIFSTYGLVVVVINALLLILLALLLPETFESARPLSVLLGGLLVGVVGLLLDTLLGVSNPILDRDYRERNGLA